MISWFVIFFINKFSHFFLGPSNQSWTLGFRSLAIRVHVAVVSVMNWCPKTPVLVGEVIFHFCFVLMSGSCYYWTHSLPHPMLMKQNSIQVKGWKVMMSKEVMQEMRKFFTAFTVIASFPFLLSSLPLLPPSLSVFLSSYAYTQCGIWLLSRGKSIWKSTRVCSGCFI